MQLVTKQNPTTFLPSWQTPSLVQTTRVMNFSKCDPQMLSEVPRQEPWNLRANGNPRPSFLKSVIKKKKKNTRHGENETGFEKKGKSSLLQFQFKPPDRNKLHSRHQHVACSTVFLKLWESFCHRNTYLWSSERSTPSTLTEATEPST